MANLVVIVVVALVIGAAVAYIVREKRRGVTCIGCPHAPVCAQKRKQQNASGCGCGCHSDQS